MGYRGASVLETGLRRVSLSGEPVRTGCRPHRSITAGHARAVLPVRGPAVRAYGWLIQLQGRGGTSAGVHEDRRSPRADVGYGGHYTSPGKTVAC